MKIFLSSLILVLVICSTPSQSFPRRPHTTSSSGGGNSETRILGSLIGLGTNIIRDVIHHSDYGHNHGHSLNDHVLGHYHDSGSHGSHHNHGHGHHDYHHGHGHNHGHSLNDHVLGHYHGSGSHGSHHNHGNGHHDSHGHHGHGHHDYHHGHGHLIDSHYGHNTHFSSSTHGHGSFGGFSSFDGLGHGNNYGSSQSSHGQSRPSRPGGNHNTVQRPSETITETYGQRDEASKPDRYTQNQNHHSTKPVTSGIHVQSHFRPITFDEPPSSNIYTVSIYKPVHGGTSGHSANKPTHNNFNKPSSLSNRPSTNFNKPTVIGSGGDQSSNNNFDKPVFLGSETSHSSQPNSGDSSQIQNNPALVAQLSNLFNQALASSDNSQSSGSRNPTHSSSHGSSQSSSGDTSSYLDQLQIRLNLKQKNSRG